MASLEVVMPVLPRVTVSDAENFWVSGGMATERPQPREWDAIKAPAAKRDERRRKSRRSMETSGGGLRKAYTRWDADRAEFVSETRACKMRSGISWPATLLPRIRPSAW